MIEIVPNADTLANIVAESLSPKGAEGAANSGGSESLRLSDGTHITFQGFTGLSAGSFL